MTDNTTTVLVVDDEATDIAIISKALQSASFDVLESDSYDSAVQMFDTRHDEIGLLLADVSLPGKTGIDLARVLLRRKRNLKVLFVSGHVGAEVIRFHGLPASDRHFLQKPFRAEDLVARVKELLKTPDRLDWLEPEKKRAGSHRHKRI